MKPIKSSLCERLHALRREDKTTTNRRWCCLTSTKPRSLRTVRYRNPQISHESVFAVLSHRSMHPRCTKATEPRHLHGDSSGSRTPVSWQMRHIGLLATLHIYRPVPVVVSWNRNNGNTGEPSGNWCLGLSTGDVSAEIRGYYPRAKFWDCVWKILQSSAFWPNTKSNPNLNPNPWTACIYLNSLIIWSCSLFILKHSYEAVLLHRFHYFPLSFSYSLDIHVGVSIWAQYSYNGNTYHVFQFDVLIGIRGLHININTTLIFDIQVRQSFPNKHWLRLPTYAK